MFIASLYLKEAINIGELLKLVSEDISKLVTEVAKLLEVIGNNETGRLALAIVIAIAMAKYGKSLSESILAFLSFPQDVIRNYLENKRKIKEEKLKIEKLQKNQKNKNKKKKKKRKKK